MKLFIFIYIFFIYKSTICAECRSGIAISESECFNNVYYFRNKNYRAGHFAMNSKGEMIVEYSSNQYRLFYGLNKKGRFVFPNVTKEIEINNETLDSVTIGRYESINSFVSLSNDINKEKEYLLSISSYTTILELYDLEQDTYNIVKAVDFLNKTLGIYSFIFQLLEVKYQEQNFYFLIYIETSNNRSPFSIYVKRFKFQNPNLNSVVEEGEIKISETGNYRITSSIVIKSSNVIAIFYIKEGYFSIDFISYNFGHVGHIDKINEYNYDEYSDRGIFFKALYLYERYVAFAYFYEYFYIKFNILKFNEVFSSLTVTKEYNIKAQDLSNIITLNEFVKLDNNRLVLISTFDGYPYLVIIFIDLYNDYQLIKVRYYNYKIQTANIDKFSSEFSAFIYNDFLIFTGTLSATNNDGDFSILLMFGYPNGTDFELDISSYFIDSDNYDISKNLYDDLMNTLKIENNVFCYEKVEKIRLISIPNEILFFDENDTLIINNDTINVNYKLKQNYNIIKENKDYYLEYQFIVKELKYPLIYTDNRCSSLVEGDDMDYNEIEGYSLHTKIYFGRVNTLKFKLCHNYCKTCRKMGISNNNQTCESCLEEYSFNNENTNELNKICIPQGYFYDKEQGILSQCTPSNSKFYINITNNKKICIKLEYDCPIDYQNYNETTKECQYSKNNFPMSSINENINNKIDTEILKNYTIEDESFEIKGDNNTIFQLTTTKNEFDRFKGSSSNENGVSIIDLGTCETVLKTRYNIDPNISLIIKKYEQLTTPSERNVQYEVYHPFTKEKLNLSLCDSKTIDLYIPLSLDEKLLELYEDLQKSGYDLFDINDPFYNDLCSPYKSKDGTDVLLSDRKNDYYNNSYTTCQSNCQYSSFDSEYQFLKCECKVIVEDIDINDFDKFSKKVYKNFYDILKNSNYKTMKCYKLVFNYDYFKKNIGNFVVLAFFLGYLIFFIIYIFKGISPLQEEINDFIYNKFKDVNIVKIENIENIKTSSKNILGKKSILKKNKEEKKKNVEFPPRKVKIKASMTESNLSLNKKRKKNRSSKFKKMKEINNTNSTYYNRARLIDKDKTVTETKKSFVESRPKNKNKKNQKQKNNKVKINTESMSKTNMNLKSQSKSKVTNTNDNNEKLDDLDLNYLPYEKAVDLDKRTFAQIYWSRLKSKHLFIYTFLSFNDHNLIYIKISRFLFLVVTSMAMNVIFFFDSSMHKIYLDYGKYNFIKQIPQIIYSSIVSLIIEILIGILSFTEKNIYEIRQMEVLEPGKVDKSIKNIKIRLIIYFIITFLFFLFYWYMISSFCAVYSNTQIIYIKDFATSFCLGLLYPFLIQLFFAFLRIYTVRDVNKSRSFLYKFC